MVSEDHGRAVPGLRWGRSRAERIALGLPVHQEPPVSDMRKIERRDRLAEIFCMEHNKRLGVLTDTALITRTAVTPYPGTSGDVISACQACARESGIVWSVNVRKLRRLMATADERRPQPVDVREVAPDTLLELLREQGLTS